MRFVYLLSRNVIWLFCPFFKLDYYFIVYLKYTCFWSIWMLCLHVCLSTTCMHSVWNWSYEQLWTSLRLLGIDLLSPGKADSVLMCWAISPAHCKLEREGKLCFLVSVHSHGSNCPWVCDKAVCHGCSPPCLKLLTSRHAGSKIKRRHQCPTVPVKATPPGIENLFLDPPS